MHQGEARRHAAMKALYQRLIAAKPPKLAIVAVARKPLVRANTLLSNDRPQQRPSLAALAATSSLTPNTDAAPAKSRGH
jgi:hypothetical protein